MEELNLEELDTAKVRILLEKINEFYSGLERVKRGDYGTLARKCRLVWLMEAYLQGLEDMCTPAEGVTLSEDGMVVSIPAGQSEPDMPPMLALPLMVGITVPERTPLPIQRHLFGGVPMKRLVLTPAYTQIATFLREQHDKRKSITLKKGVYELKEIVTRRGVLARQNQEVMLYIKGFNDLAFETEPPEDEQNYCTLTNDV